MAHEDAGHYAAKHPKGTQMNSQIADQVTRHLVDGKISCAAAHKIAEDLGISPTEVGVTIDLLERRIHQCLLGLFGYSPKRRIIEPAEQVAPELQHAIEAASEEQGLACAAAWELAERFKVSKVEISSACEALQIKIFSCQLGTF